MIVNDNNETKAKANMTKQTFNENVTHLTDAQIKTRLTELQAADRATEYYVAHNSQGIEIHGHVEMTPAEVKAHHAALSQHEAIRELHASLDATIKHITTELSVAILVGSPFLILADHGNDRVGVYGEWARSRFPGHEKESGTTQGFMTDWLVPDSLCGTFQFSPERADAVVASVGQLYAKDGVTFRKMHYREFLTQRLNRSVALKRKLEDYGK